VKNPQQEQLAALASFLADRQEVIVEAWLKAVDEDPLLETASTLSITHLRDIIPRILDNFEWLLRSGFQSLDAELEEDKDVAEHGQHRWQQAYSLRELVREWHHLQLCVLDELESYGVAHPEVSRDVFIAVRRAWMQHCNDGVCDSVQKYSELQQAEALGILRDLREAMAHLKALERQRAETLHEAVHDLRGNLGLVTVTTALLNEDGVPDALRAKAWNTLQTGALGLQQMLEDLMSLARLEAGREQRQVEAFDAAARLRALGASLEPLARERKLSLRLEGPETLLVEGDAVKVLRIVQNLALNAIKYTRSGGVIISWSESCEADIERWLIRVQDTGPGLEATPASPIAGELREATRIGWEVEQESPDTVEPMPEPGLLLAPRSDQRPGEGIGLSIVKRLCELLDASLEMTSRPGEGTLFQVSLPRRYTTGGSAG
jgi:two-component sensor histidine kinase